jgi:hypothetical protein
MIAALTVLLIGAVIAGVVAVNQRDEARTQRDIGISNGLATRADEPRQVDQSLAAQLDVVAYHVHQSPELRMRLLERWSDRGDGRVGVGNALTAVQALIRSSIQGRSARRCSHRLRGPRVRRAGRCSSR